ncbi:ATP-binding protein [Domibacillus robiginosus]|uniref:ATP-binding protein n=1 Tax=Domibacillus robiginosus TaxID=1071054 RepID=UPI00067C1BDA|nr:ATP-binding protein [Domibacillus robiginosus]
MLSKEIAREHNVEVEFHNNYNSLMLFANKAYLQQAFINLIKNSIEAVPEDRQKRKIEIQTGIDGDFIIIDLMDTGRGIPIENRDSIFDPFISFTSQGMGMGLPFVKKVVFEHRGDINIIHSSPEGTQFQIKFSQF